MGIDHMLKYQESIERCAYCMGAEIDSGQCRSWVENIKRKKCGDGFDCCYANKDQVTALLDYWNAKNGTIQEYNVSLSDIEDKDFRIGDPVWHPVYGNGLVRYICDGSSWPIKVTFETGTTESFNFSGTAICTDFMRMLYHGHNLKITVEEKKPVRSKTGWVFVYQLADGRISALPNEVSDKEQCLDVINNFNMLGNNVLTGPIKVEIPE